MISSLKDRGGGKLQVSTCREEILATVASMTIGSADSFTVSQVVNAMRLRNSRYAESTIRTHITSRMCHDAPANHSSRFSDLERVARGRYRVSQLSPPRGSSIPPATSGADRTRTPTGQLSPGDSSVQRGAEAVALRELGEMLRADFTPHRFPLPTGGHLEIDGLSHDPPVLVEVWAHQGSPKAAQRNKVLSDAFKLQYARNLLGNYRLVLCLTDEEAAAPFVGRTWYANALKHANIEIHVVDIPDELRSEIRAAQVRQYR